MYTDGFESLIVSQAQLVGTWRTTSLCNRGRPISQRDDGREPSACRVSIPESELSYADD